MYDTATGGGFDGLEQADATRTRAPSRRWPRRHAAAGRRLARPGECITGPEAAGHPHRRLAPARTHAPVITKLFVPGEEPVRATPGPGRSSSRILAITEDQTKVLLEQTLARFGRHHDLLGVLERHFDLVAHRIGETDLPGRRTAPCSAPTSPRVHRRSRRPVQPVHGRPSRPVGLGQVDTRFVLSPRASARAICPASNFGPGVISARGQIRRCDHDREPRCDQHGRAGPPDTSAGVARPQLVRAADRATRSRPSFLDNRCRPSSPPTISTWSCARYQSRCSPRQRPGSRSSRSVGLWRPTTTVEFPADSRIDERILFPYGPTERHGMEDARFVRFTRKAERSPTSPPTRPMTAPRWPPQLLHTDDFPIFRRAAQRPGGAQQGHGDVPAPGRWAVCGPVPMGPGAHRDRRTRPTTSAGASPSPSRPRAPWELMQIGNCGSPIETSRGWLVLHPRRRTDARLLHRRGPAGPRRPGAPASAASPTR